nr:MULTISPECIES: aspartate transaminase [unclassified Herbaspirillum]
MESRVTSPRIADRVRRIKQSPSSAAAERAAELRRQGKDIVNLVVGEPDFDTPAHIRRAAAEAIESGQTRYTPTAGTPALRQAISEKLARENQLAYAPREIIATCGAKHAIFNALAITVQSGDEVLVPAPYWVSYPDMVLACDGTPVVVPCVEEDGFKLTPAVLDAAITARTKWLIINSPSNPTGAAYTLEELQALAEVLRRHPQVLVMTDDIYEHIRFDGQPTPHLLNAAPDLRERTLLINGVSKTYAMTGWRIGYAAGPSDLIGALDILQSQSTSNPSSVSQAAALAALTGDQGFVAEFADTYRRRRDRGLELINAIDGLSCRKPEGAFYLFINCSGLLGRQTPEGKVIESDIDVVMYFLESTGVALVAGTAYGLSPYMRMSIATSVETIEEGCRRMAGAVAALR